MNVEKVLVLGAGTMGTGITQVIAGAGIDVQLRDVEEKLVERGLAVIEESLHRSVKKDRISKREKEEIMASIEGITDVDQVDKETDVVIEAIVEKMEIKKKVIREVSEILPEDVYLFSNTSALSVTEIFSAIDNPERSGGLHFFNPVPAMKLVELIKGVETSTDTVKFMRNFAREIGKKPVEVAEAPGFVVNRMLIPLINEAVFTLREGIASAEDIDRAMKLGAGHPMGPLELADMIGLDVCLAIMETLYEEFGDSKYRPCPLLRKKVRAGHLGKKTGEGFYKY